MAGGITETGELYSPYVSIQSLPGLQSPRNAHTCIHISRLANIRHVATPELRLQTVTSWSMRQLWLEPVWCGVPCDVQQVKY